MKVTELQELIKSNTADDTVNFDEIAKIINDETNVIRDNAINKFKETAKKELAPDILNDFIKQYQFENVDQFKAFVDNSKASSNEVSAKATRLEQELKEYTNKYTELQSQYNEANSKLTQHNQMQLAKKLGVKEEMLDFAIYEANKLVTDDVDIEKALGKLIEDKPLLANEQEKERFKIGEKKPDDKQPKGGSNFERFLELNKNKGLR